MHFKINLINKYTCKIKIKQNILSKRIIRIILSKSIQYIYYLLIVYRPPSRKWRIDPPKNLNATEIYSKAQAKNQACLFMKTDYNGFKGSSERSKSFVSATGL